MNLCKFCNQPTKYNIHRKKFAIYCCKSCANKDPIRKIKIRQTCILKFGGPNPSASPNTVHKSKQTSIKNYGTDNYTKSESFRILMESRKMFIPLENKTKFEKYKLAVLSETRKWKEQLLTEWNGKDYYTGETLKTDPEKYNDLMYRTIDHKISIYNGFSGNIDPFSIGHITNLCITSRSNNSSKQRNNQIPS